MKKLLIAALITCTLAAMAISMTGCKKTADTAVTPYFQIPQEVADHLALPVGSHFIYRDSTTGLEDSVVVKESSVQKVFVASHLRFYSMTPDANADSLTLKMTNETANGTSDWLFVSHLQQNGTVSFYNNRKAELEKELVFWDPVTTFFANDDNNGGFILQSMDVEGVTYSNVYRFLSTTGSPATAGYLRTDYYWVKGTGLIKRVVTDDAETHSWTLVRKG